MNGNGGDHADDVFEALSDVQRRKLLVDLLEHNPQTVETISEASREVGGMSEGLKEEYLASDAEISGADKSHVRLYHVHLPMLVEYGFVEWDRESNTVVKGARFDAIRPVLELLEENHETLPAGWL
ncbi:hypothetical protein HWV07_05950 [Natronomonas salina]|uniref:DUF7344 domain-containing protein n=1 Tax=Natronomonas salina TaxID=1710540 RepID=UPI0015B48367|nr:hypothetical protein [Natronomonas salina]QLD88598.1 hypothetical protein HWV07_05950 [Natronomonas salina]